MNSSFQKQFYVKATASNNITVDYFITELNKFNQEQQPFKSVFLYSSEDNLQYYRQFLCVSLVQINTTSSFKAKPTTVKVKTRDCEGDGAHGNKTRDRASRTCCPSGSPNQQLICSAYITTHHQQTCYTCSTLAHRCLSLISRFPVDTSGRSACLAMHSTTTLITAERFRHLECVVCAGFRLLVEARPAKVKCYSLSPAKTLTSSFFTLDWCLFYLCFLYNLFTGCICFLFTTRPIFNFIILGHRLLLAHSRGGLLGEPRPSAHWGLGDETH